MCLIQPYGRVLRLRHWMVRAFFRKISIFHGVITWMDGRIDIVPETVYEENFAYEDAESQPVRATTLTEEQMNRELEKGYTDMLDGKTKPEKKAFADLNSSDFRIVLKELLLKNVPYFEIKQETYLSKCLNLEW